VDPGLVLRGKVECATVAAGGRYRPGPFDGRVCLFIPSEDWVHSIARPLRWRSVAPDTEQYFGPRDSSMNNMLLEPHAATFAELFQQAARKRCGGTSDVPLRSAISRGR
jgi:thioesterase domain-containing protein